MVRSRISILSLCLFVSACSAQAESHTLEHGQDAIYRSCIENGAAAADCLCVYRESRLRFSQQERLLIPDSRTETDDSIEATSTRERLQERLRQSDLSEPDRAALIRRVLNAHIVIENTCGVGLYPDVEPG